MKIENLKKSLTSLFNYTPKYFSYYELTKTSKKCQNTPKDFQTLKTLFKLVYLLDFIRQDLNQPIYINSAFRSPECNSLVDGVPNSYHLFGRAADIRCSGLSSTELFKRVLTLFELPIINTSSFENEDFEIIRYNTFVHFAFKF